MIPGMTTNIPRRFEDLTPSGLTSLLGGSAIVNRITVEPIGRGAGFLGQLARLRVTYHRSDATAPATLIGKLPTLDPGGREICRAWLERRGTAIEDLDAGALMP